MKLFKKMFIIIWNGFAVIGLFTVCVGFAGMYILAQSYGLSPHQLISKVAKKAGILEPSAALKVFEPADRYADYRFQGTLKTGYPRILYKTVSDVQRIRDRYKSDEHYKKTTDAYAKGASAWFCKKDGEQGQKALQQLLDANVTEPRDVGDYGNALSPALQYDLLYDHPSLTVEHRRRINILFRTYLKSAIQVLNGDSASLWHGRFQLACATFVVASVMENTSPEEKDLLRKAQAHFLDAVEAIRITGGWPEGYNYWINNRAYPFALACLAHMNSVDAPELNEKIRTVLETVGLWTIYGTRPDGRFALFGDTGPRNDLKEETQRFIDLVLLGTGNSVFKHYSVYLDTRQKDSGYYYDYRWGIPVFRGLPENDHPAGLVYKDLSFLNNALPNSRIFGSGSFNQIFIRSGWGPEDTFISFMAGDSFAHHGHYQAGHFTLDKFAPLALTSGTYGEYTSPHRLNYYIRTIAANSILIQKPGESIKPNQFFSDNVSDGGQRIIIPTGSAITGVENWKQNLTTGRTYKGATLKAFDNSDPAFVYVEADLTPAYSPDKAKKVIRRICYLTREDLLIIHDMVESTQKTYTQKWLLHSWSKPETRTETLIRGTDTNGILQTRDRTTRINHQDGSLNLTAVLPEDAVLTKIGGQDFRYYVETDGDDSSFDGMNMTAGANEKPWFDAGLWRLELTSQHQSPATEFLVLLKPGHKNDALPVEYKPITTPSYSGVQIKDTVVLFSKYPDKPDHQHEIFPQSNDLKYIIL